MTLTPSLSLELSREASSLDNSQSSTNVADSEETLLWQPMKMQAKGSAARHWIVENTKRCSEFCKDQLKVSNGTYIADNRETKMGSCGHLKPKSPRRLGLSSLKPFIAKTVLHMFFAGIVTLLFAIPIAMPIKVLQTCKSIWLPASSIVNIYKIKPANILRVSIYLIRFSIPALLEIDL